MQKNKRFVTLFPWTKDYLFYDDPVQIPYRFKKLGFECEVVAFINSDNYSIIPKHIKMIGIKEGYKLSRSHLNATQSVATNSDYSNNMDIFANIYKSVFSYLLNNSRNIDILYLFHIRWITLLWAFIYKILNKNGFVYLKLDHCAHSGTYIWENIFDSKKEPEKFMVQPKPTLKYRIKCFLIRKYFVKAVDLWSVEDEESQDYWSKEYNFFKNNLVLSYNGHTADVIKPKRLNCFADKENIILSVGRFGTHQKATEILLEAFVKIANKNDWVLHLAGRIIDEFKSYIEEYFYKYPELKNRIVFHNFLNKKDLFNLYNRSKIFCLPSRYEAFAVVLAEAMYFNNAIITTPYVSPRKIIKDGKGLLVERDDVNALAEAMHCLIDHPDKIKEFGEAAHKFAESELNWDKIVNDLYNEMKIRGLNV